MDFSKNRRKGKTTILKNIKTGKIHEFNSRIRAAEFIGVSRTAINNSWKRKGIIGKKYRIISISN